MIENNYIFGFFEECKVKYDEEIWNEFNDLFTYFPLASLIDKKIYCVSSGLSHSIKTIEQMKNITRNQEMT
jgi:serine/threonine-protein phosphatase PP1 catalytic subunit